MVCPTRATIFSTKDLWLIETAAVRNRMPGGVGGTAVMSRLPTRLDDNESRLLLKCLSVPDVHAD